MAKTLEGVRVGVLVADGFEQVEVTRPLRALRRHGAQVDVISLRKGTLRGMNFMWPGRKLRVDEPVKKVSPEEFDALFIPGGFVNPDLLRQSGEVLEFVRRFHDLSRPIATLCHGPQVLVSAGLVRGRRLTSWPGIKDDIRNAGGEWVSDSGVRDRMLFSSRGPQDLRTFVKGMLQLYADHAPRNHPLPERRRRWPRLLLAALGVWAAREGVRRLRPALTA